MEKIRMQTQILTPTDLFQNRIRYTIPDFQRPYIWKKGKQWEPFWEDIKETAENYLERLAASDNHSLEAETQTHPHFMGAVVIQQVNTTVTQVARREVIDGQQRMTTIQLLLDAIQYVFESKEELKGGAERLSELVQNSKRGGMSDDDVFKLWPTTVDREAFRHAMQNGLDIDKFTNSPIVQAHDYFQRRAKEWLEYDPDPESFGNRAQALETAVSVLLQMVVIEIGENEDPYIIFETLNARGTPLLESDLIKNFVMSRVSDANRKTVWGDLDDKWWGQEITQGRITRPRKEALFNYWLAMRNASEVTANRVFTEFRKQAKKSVSIEDLMADVNRDLGNYRQFMSGDRTPYEDKFHYRVNEVMEIRAITPAFLLLLSAPDEARLKSLKILESYLVRGMLCRGNSQGYNRVTHELVGALRESGLDAADKVVFEFLKNQTAHNRQWPDDRHLGNTLNSRTLYRVLTRRRLRMVLEAIEEYLRANSLAEQQSVPPRLSIEHVMPRSWERHWPLPGDIADKREAAANRNSLIHTIGNLTLTSQSINSGRLSNNAWERKRAEIDDHSVLFINKTLLQESEGVAWDEDFIQARSRRMAQIIAQVWPGPDSPAWGE